MSQLRSFVLPCWGEEERFRLPAAGTINDQQAVPFEGLETVAQIPFVMLETPSKGLMATGHAAVRALRLGNQPPENAFLELGQAHRRHRCPAMLACPGVPTVWPRHGTSPLERPGGCPREER